MVTTIVQRCVRALSLDAALNERLHSGSIHGQVHSVFERVTNVISRDEHLVALCARTCDDAPWTVRVDVADWSDYRFAPGDTIEIARDGIAFRGEVELQVVFNGPSTWDARSVPLEADATTLAARIRVLTAMLEARGVRGGALAPSTHVDPFAAAVAARLSDKVDAIARAEVAGDSEAVAEAVEGMLGLGPGLTPAGDDVLTGLALVAAQAGSRVAILPRVLADALAKRPDCTTLLSRVTLQEALRGRARQMLVDLLERLSLCDLEAGASAHSLRSSVEGVLGIGHTSGTDILSGILAGLRLESQMRGSV